MTSSTRSGNSADSGSGIYNDVGSEITIVGSNVANSPYGSNCAGNPVIDGGYNLEDADTCGFDPANGSLPNTDRLI